MLVLFICYMYDLQKFTIYLFIVYFIIVFKPFEILYKLSGLLMTFDMLVGYAICFMNIAFIAESSCRDTSFGRVGYANTIIFLVVGSFVVVFAHVIVWLPLCKKVCERKKDE